MASGFILLLLVQVLKCDAKVSSIIVFGDSTVDPGNNNYIPTVLKSNFKPYGRDLYGGKPTGRFSNGRLATDFISEAFGLKKMIPAYLDPAYGIQDFATGVSFASAGTGLDNFTSKILINDESSLKKQSVIPLWKELEHYKEYQARLRQHLGGDESRLLLSEALYIISIGTNDFLENYYFVPKRPSEYNVEEYQKFLLGIARSFITQLYEMGARKISLTGLTPMGCLPLERTANLAPGRGCMHAYNTVALSFNRKLNLLVNELNERLFGLRLVFSNPYEIVDNIIRNPTFYGFEEAAEGCCGTGKFEIGYLCDEENPFTCLDANKYVFWDAFHPTEKTCSIVVNYAMKHSLGVFL